MNKNKLYKILSIPFLALAIFVLSVSINKARAESNQQKDYPASMVQMMQQIHGSDWKADCTKMMDQLEENST